MLCSHLLIYSFSLSLSLARCSRPKSCFRLSLALNIVQILLAMIAPILIVGFGAKEAGGFGAVWEKIKGGKLINLGE